MWDGKVASADGAPPLEQRAHPAIRGIKPRESTYGWIACQEEEDDDDDDEDEEEDEEEEEVRLEDVKFKCDPREAMADSWGKFLHKSSPGSSFTTTS